MAQGNSVTHPSLSAFMSEPTVDVTLISGPQIQCFLQELTVSTLQGQTMSGPLCTSLDFPVNAGCSALACGVVAW